MNYLVQMKLAAHSRPSSPQDGITFIEGYILPSLEILKKLEAEKKVLSGGGIIGIVLIVRAETAEDLDKLLSGIPVWPLMETTITPLTTFESRIAALRPRLDHLKAGLRQ